MSIFTENKGLNNSKYQPASLSKNFFEKIKPGGFLIPLFR